MTEPNTVEGQVSQDARGVSLVTTAVTAPLPVPTATDTATAKDTPNPPTAPAAQSDVQVRIQFAEATHQYIRDFIKLADQKAAFFFAGATALLAFLYRNNVSSRWLKPVMEWNIIDTSAFLAMVALAIGAIITMLVLVPNTGGSRRGFIFWEAIAEHGTGRNYADELSVLSPASLFQVKAEHCHDLAKVCRTKYKLLRWGLCICGVGLLTSLVVFLTSVRPNGPEPTLSPDTQSSAPPVPTNASPAGQVPR